MQSLSFIVTPLQNPLNADAQDIFNLAGDATPRETNEHFVDALEKSTATLGLNVLRTGLAYGHNGVLPWAEVSLSEQGHEIGILRRSFTVTRKQEPSVEHANIVRLY